MASYVAVKLYGPGHVVAYNYIADFHDGINVETYGNPDGSVAVGPGHRRRPEVSDARVLGPAPGGDRLLQQLHHQLPRQPDRDRRQHAQHPRDAEHVDQLTRRTRSAISRRSAGRSTGSATSPITCRRGSTRLTNGAAGVLFYNNTILSETAAAGASNTHWRNNLMLGENAAPAIFTVTPTPTTPRPTTTASGRIPAPSRRSRGTRRRAASAADFTGPGSRRRRLETRQFATLAEYSQATGQDAQRAGRLRRVRERAAARRAGRRRRCRSSIAPRISISACKPGVGGGRSRRGAAERHRRFAGRAPDLGALEVGQRASQYGPRTATTTRSSAGR